MAIAEQFTGMDMDQLVAAPLVAVAEAQMQLAHSTAGFIRRVGLDENGRPRTAAFWYQQDGIRGEEQDRQVEVPLLAMVPVPNLQIDEVGLTFDIEVRQSERKESERAMEGNVDGGVGFGPAKIAVRGTVSSHSHHTRQSDYSAKYHLEIHASDHGTPEALERVRDIMISNCILEKRETE